MKETGWREPDFRGMPFGCHITSAFYMHPGWQAVGMGRGHYCETPSSDFWRSWKRSPLILSGQQHTTSTLRASSTSNRRTPTKPCMATETLPQGRGFPFALSEPVGSDQRCPQCYNFFTYKPAFAFTSWQR